MPLNFKKIPAATTVEIRKALEKNGFKADETNHKHIKLLNEKRQELILIKGNKEVRKDTLRFLIKQFAEHKGITPEEALKLLFEKK